MDPIDQTTLDLAYALFVTDPRVVILVALRCETAVVPESLFESAWKLGEEAKNVKEFALRVEAIGRAMAVSKRLKQPITVRLGGELPGEAVVEIGPLHEAVFVEGFGRIESGEIVVLEANGRGSFRLLKRSKKPYTPPTLRRLLP